MDNSLYKLGLVYSIDESISPSKFKTIKDFSKYNFSKIEKRINKNQIGFVIKGDQSYHYKLEKIKPKVYILYYMGNINLLNKKIIGIVGPRDMTMYAKQVMDLKFEMLKGCDFVTVSGLAEGVDQYCHKLSMNNNVPTIAVLGGGIAYYLMSKKRDLIYEIVEKGGLILSEFKLKAEPTVYTFPQRNRIIAGVSDYVFLPEAGYKSGSLITADFADKMGIPVYGVPGSIFSESSRGLNQYLSENRIELVYAIESFLSDQFGKSLDNKDLDKNFGDLEGQERAVVDILLRKGKCDLNTLLEGMKIDLSELMVLITGLEVKGIIKEASIGEYCLKH